MKTPVFPIALAAAAAVALPALAERTILPGYWESANHTSVVFEQDSTSRKCLTPDLVESYLAGPVTHHYTCAYDRREVGDGKVRLVGECVDRNGIHMKVDIHGDYMPESFHLKAKLLANLGGLPIEGTATTDAHRISAVCPTEEPAPGRAPPPPPPQ